MGLSKAMSEFRQARLTIHNDVKWCLDMVKDLEKGELGPFPSKEAMLEEMKGVLESVLENINN